MLKADPHALLTLSLRLLCAGVLLRSIQLLLNWRELPDQRLLGWNPKSRARRALAWRLRGLLSFPGCAVLLMLQTTAATLGLFSPIASSSRVWLVGGLFLLQAWFNYRFAIIYHAADTMFLIGLGAVFAAALDPKDPWLQFAALAFLGLQSLLAYFMSGWSKIGAQAWRDGSQLIEILRRSAFRMEFCGRWLALHPSVAKIGVRGVIALELMFPFGLLAPSSLFVALLTCGALLHATNAFIMGLPGFFWSFVATYPALWFLHQRFHTGL